jgi:hypothetical protein
MPKEKAADLFSKFLDSNNMIFNIEGAKECALIVVDEILKNNLILFEDALNDKYWEEVKQEIIRI